MRANEAVFRAGGMGRQADARSPGNEETARSGRVRIASVFVRAAHLVAASGVAGAVLLGEGGGGWWLAATGTGVGLLGTEFLLHPRMHREACGLATALKLLLLALVPAASATAPWLMGAAIAVAAVGAHAPRWARHRRIW